MKGLFITLEGTEGCGKSTQIALLGQRLRAAERTVRLLREPGGTPIGEEIRATLKSSPHNHAMTPEAELLLMNASRAQLVREIIRPALIAGEIVLCDRFYDSTLAYQGFGRRLNLDQVRSLIDFAVGDTRPDATFLLDIPLEVAETRCQQRKTAQPPERDRFEEAQQDFFKRVVAGYRTLAEQEPARIKVIDGTQDVSRVHEALWVCISRLLAEGND